ncbi:MAG TPA: DsbA family protein [Longimicrobiales bacterium]|nr:DsbA family protein [Longimicrobiales bacterium]
MAEKRLVVFADYACPFCYLAEVGAVRLREAGLEVRGAAFELRPPGTPLPDARAPWMAQAWEQSVEPLAAEAGVSMAQPALMTRTRKAHEAAAYARSQGMYDRMHAALYAAYWQDGRDIGRIDVLVDIARAAGLDPSGLRVALDIDQCTARVEQDEAWAARLGLAGVPAYVLTDDADGTGTAADTRIGLQRYDELRAWMGFEK